MRSRALTVYDMAKAIDKEMVDHGDHARRARRRSARLRAAVLTVSDRVSRGEAEDGSGDTARGAPARRRLRGRSAGSSPTSATEIARAIVDLAPTTRARADDGRHRPRGARRDARGDALGARARGARDRRGDPRRTRSRRRRTGCSRARVAGTVGTRARRQPRRLARRLPRRLRGAAPRRSPHALRLLADQASATDHVTHLTVGDRERAAPVSRA